MERETYEIEIVLNIIHGGFSVSSWAKQKLNSPGNYDDFRNDRANKQLINLIKNYGSYKVSGEFSYLSIKYVPYEYFKLNCFSIDEYDGKESLQLHHDLYQMIKIKQIIQDNEINSYQKIEQLKSFIQSISVQSNNTNAPEYINHGWESLIDKRGVTYYSNYTTQEESYICPENFIEKDHTEVII